MTTIFARCRGVDTMDVGESSVRPIPSVAGPFMAPEG
jgi:hypothetical protein